MQHNHHHLIFQLAYTSLKKSPLESESFDMPQINLLLCSANMWMVNIYSIIQTAFSDKNMEYGLHKAVIRNVRILQIHYILSVAIGIYQHAVWCCVDPLNVHVSTSLTNWSQVE